MGEQGAAPKNRLPVGQESNNGLPPGKKVLSIQRNLLVPEEFAKRMLIQRIKGIVRGYEGQKAREAMPVIADLPIA